MEPNTYIPSKDDKNVFFRNNFTYIPSNSIESIDPSYVKDNYFVPVYIFSNGLSGLEAISKYLKEVIKLRFCDIAKLTNRDDRTIWDAYNSAKKKSQGNFAVENSQFSVPTSIFNNRTLSVLENLAVYLKEELNLRYCDIAILLNKDQRTIWTAYNRAKKKRKNVENN